MGKKQNYYFSLEKDTSHGWEQVKWSRDRKTVVKFAENNNIKVGREAPNRNPKNVIRRRYFGDSDE